MLILVSSGVPSLSLGAILFIMYVNDMVEYITENTLVQYAYDSQFLHYDSVRNILNIIKKAEITHAKAKGIFCYE